MRTARAQAVRRAGWGLALAVLSGCSLLGRTGVDPEPPFPDRAPTFELEVAVRADPSGAQSLDLWMTAPSRGARGLGLGLTSPIRWTAEVLTRPEGRELYEESWVGTDEPARDWVERSIAVVPGSLVVVVTAEVEATGDVSTVRREIHVDEASGSPLLQGLRLELGSGSSWRPLIALATEARGDSLRVRAQALQAAGTFARLQVERLVVDDEVAAPLPRVAPAPRARGGAADTVYVRRDSVESDLADLRWTVPPLGPGVYRVHAELDRSRQERTIVVRRAGFPSVERVGDLIGPMAYITTEAEQRALTARRDPYLQRRAFDRFWGDRLADRREAASVVRAFSDRVEEANARFSTYKAGWKTDRGMVLVLFGRPQRINRSARTEEWVYTSGPVAGLVLPFASTPGPGPLTTWTVPRSPAYEVAWERARRAWRRGDVP